MKATEMTPQKVSIALSFNCGGAIFFHAVGCESLNIKDPDGVGRQVMDKFRKNAWNLNWVVVMGVVRSAATTIAISGQEGAKLSLETGFTTSPTLDLADTALRLQLRSASGVNFHLVSAEGLTPLFLISRIQRPWFSKPEFGPALAEGGRETDWQFSEVK
jgi:hypothetical protein